MRDELSRSRGERREAHSWMRGSGIWVDRRNLVMVRHESTPPVVVLGSVAAGPGAALSSDVCSRTPAHCVAAHPTHAAGIQTTSPPSSLHSRPTLRLGSTQHRVAPRFLRLPGGNQVGRIAVDLPRCGSLPIDDSVLHPLPFPSASPLLPPSAAVSYVALARGQH